MMGGLGNPAKRRKERCRPPNVMCRLDITTTRVANISTFLIYKDKEEGFQGLRIYICVYIHNSCLYT
jgi:hypothetical protein